MKGRRLSPTRFWRNVRFTLKQPREVASMLLLGKEYRKLMLGRTMMDDPRQFRSGQGGTDVQVTIDAFSQLYHDRSPETFESTRWMGLTLLKTPTDLWVYQEIIFETRPDFIVETGTNLGGSALFFANICDIVGNGHVITVDVAKRVELEHPRITQIIGGSTDRDTVERIHKLVGGRPALVSLDADHDKDHVLREMRAYAELVPAGGYMVVEDSDLNGHPVLPAGWSGAYEAIEEFLPEHPEFEPDVSREKYMLTCCPNGWLKRVR